jgi:hypothetical protein
MCDMREIEGECGMEVRITNDDRLITEKVALTHVKVYYTVLNSGNELQGKVIITEDTSSWTHDDFKEYVLKEIELILREAEEGRRF